MIERDTAEPLSTEEKLAQANDALKAIKLAFDEAMQGNTRGARLLHDVALEVNPEVHDFLKSNLLPPDLDINNSNIGELRLAIQRPDAFSEPYPDQNYFWTPEWQADEQEAEGEAVQGLGKSFSTAGEMFKELNPDLG